MSLIVEIFVPSQGGTDETRRHKTRDPLIVSIFPIFVGMPLHFDDEILAFDPISAVKSEFPIRLRGL